MPSPRHWIVLLGMLKCASTLLLPSPTHGRRHASFGHHAIAADQDAVASRASLGPLSPASSRRGWLASAAALLALPSVAPAARAVEVLSDEYVVVVDEGPVGIELMDLSRYLNELRVAVKRIVPGGAADEAVVVAVNDVLVSVNGRTLETSTAAQVQAAISKAPRPLTLVLRRPGAFRALLAPPAQGGAAASARADGNAADEGAAAVFEPFGAAVRTQVAPAANGQAAQVASVARTEVPDLCTKGAKKGDLLELTYAGYLKADPSVKFDGSAALINGAEQSGRGGETAVFFVLGQQPAGQFPPGWDVGLVGMCVGERRRLEVPAALAYGRKGLPRRRIPPDADLVYDVKLISSNGDAQQR